MHSARFDRKPRDERRHVVATTSSNAAACQTYYVIEGGSNPKRVVANIHEIESVGVVKIRQNVSIFINIIVMWQVKTFPLILHQTVLLPMLHVSIGNKYQLHRKRTMFIIFIQNILRFYISQFYIKKYVFG